MPAATADPRKTTTRTPAQSEAAVGAEPPHRARSGNGLARNGDDYVVPVAAPPARPRKTTRERTPAPSEAAVRGEPPSQERSNAGQDRYVVPVIHRQIPAWFVDAGFLGALAGSVALGTVDLPLALLIAGAVVVSRHRARQPLAMI
jgi:hypothetical protein